MSLKVHRLSIADCICISGFWGLSPKTLTGALPLDPAGDFLVPGPLCPPYLETMATPLYFRAHYEVRELPWFSEHRRESTRTLGWSEIVGS